MKITDFVFWSFSPFFYLSVVCFCTDYSIPSQLMLLISNTHTLNLSLHPLPPPLPTPHHPNLHPKKARLRPELTNGMRHSRQYQRCWMSGSSCRGIGCICSLYSILLILINSCHWKEKDLLLLSKWCVKIIVLFYFYHFLSFIGPDLILWHLYFYHTWYLLSIALYSYKNIKSLFFNSSKSIIYTNTNTTQ